ncbi:hypothetical protein JCM8115_007093 [Rhodotorula mucilaginosa]
MDSPVPPPPRGALERVFASCAASDSLDSFTLKHVRTALAASPIRWECSDKQWKQQVRDQIRLEWTALLEARQAEQAPSPPAHQATSSDPESEQDEQEDDDDEDSKPRTKYDRAAEKNVKVLLGAFGDFLGGLTGPASDLEDRSEDEDDDDDDDDDDATPPEKKQPAKKKKRKSIAISSSGSDPSDPSDKEEERPRPSKKNKKQRKSAGADSATAEKGPKASRASLSKSKSEQGPTSSKFGKRESSERRRTAAKEEEITITDSEDSEDSDAADPKAHQQKQPVASTSKATPRPPPATTMPMRDSDLSEVEDTGFLPGAGRRRRSGAKKGVKGVKGKGKAKAAGTDEEEEEEEEEGGTTTSRRKGKGKGTALKENKKEGKKKKAERKAPAPLKPGDAPKGTDAEEDRIKKLKELAAAAGTSRPFTASTGAERTLTVSRRIEILEGVLEKLGLMAVNKGDGDRRMPSLSKAKQVGEKRALEKEMQELGGTAHHTGLRTGKELHAVSDSSSDDEDGGAGGGDEKQAGLSASAKKKKQVLAERKKFEAFLGAQSDEDSESD